MISEKQLAANRRNAQLSCGPVSAVGKRRVGLNNLRHGLTGHTTVLSEDERAAHDQFCAGIVANLQPEGALELQMAQSIAEDHWRLNRVPAIENNIFALGQLKAEAEAPESEDADPEIDAALNSARVFLADAGKFALLSLYEQRIHRNLLKTMAEFRSLQSARIQQSAAKATVMGSGEMSAQAATDSGRSRGGVMGGKEKLLAENGFEFSNRSGRVPITPAPIRYPKGAVITGLCAMG